MYLTIYFESRVFHVSVACTRTRGRMERVESRRPCGAGSEIRFVCFSEARTLLRLSWCDSWSPVCGYRWGSDAGLVVRSETSDQAAVALLLLVATMAQSGGQSLPLSMSSLYALDATPYLCSTRTTVADHR